jgi:hypothetical protein
MQSTNSSYSAAGCVAFGLGLITGADRREEDRDSTNALIVCRVASQAGDRGCGRTGPDLQ